MVDFDELNRATREHNARNVDRFNTSTPSCGSPEHWQNVLNNQTFKNNNGEFSKKYF